MYIIHKWIYIASVLIPKVRNQPVCFMFLKIGHLKKGLNPLSVSELAFGSPYLSLAIKTGIITGVIGLAVSLFITLPIFYASGYFYLGDFLMQTGIYIYNIYMFMQEGVAVGRSFATFKNYHIDGNKEMIAFGMMNIAGSCSSCYLTAGIHITMPMFCNYMLNRKGQLQA